VIFGRPGFFFFFLLLPVRFAFFPFCDWYGEPAPFDRRVFSEQLDRRIFLLFCLPAPPFSFADVSALLMKPAAVSLPLNRALRDVLPRISLLLSSVFSLFFVFDAFFSFFSIGRDLCTAEESCKFFSLDLLSLFPTLGLPGQAKRLPPCPTVTAGLFGSPVLCKAFPLFSCRLEARLVLFFFLALDPLPFTIAVPSVEEPFLSFLQIASDFFELLFLVRAPPFFFFFYLAGPDGFILPFFRVSAIVF